MDLHRPRNRPDWQLVDEASRNIYQKIAVHTFGIVTPGNVVTTLGLVLVFYGSWLLYQEVAIVPLALIAGGRLADLVDGYIADKTKTKSAIGETYDSVVDKITAFSVLVLFVLSGIMLFWQVALLLLLQLVNSVIILKAKLSKKVIHSSLAGKQATFLLWLTIGAFAAVALLSTEHFLTLVTTVLGNVLLVATLFRGLQASYGYYRNTV